MESRMISDVRRKCAAELKDALFKAVEQYGGKPSKSACWDYGFDGDDENILKVLDFLDNGGCYFAVQTDVNSQMGTESLCQYSYNEFTHYSFVGLYLEKENDGEILLKYYAFVNTGIIANIDDADADHGYVMALPIDVLYKLIFVVDNLIKAKDK